MTWWFVRPMLIAKQTELGSLPEAKQKDCRGIESSKG
jgi:hypothetical protein